MASCSLLLRRSLSTTPAVRQLIRAPVQVHGVEGRYATALYSAASKQNQLDNVEKELKVVQNLYHTNNKFKEFVLDPTLQKTSKKNAMEAILKKLGVSEVSFNLFALVAENGRLNKLEAIVKSFESIMSGHRGELYCQVVVAKELDSTMQKQLNEALQAFTKGDQKLHVTTKVDPALIGGMIVTVGDKYVDMSVASKVKKYTNLLNEAV